MILRFLYIFIYLRLFNDVNNTLYNFNLLNFSKKKTQYRCDIDFI